MLPVMCDECQKTSLVQSPIDGDMSGTIFTGNITNCPRCGGRAVFADVRLDMRNDVISDMRMLRSDQLASFVELLKSHDTKHDNDLILERASEISAGFAALVSAFQKVGGFTLLIAILTVYLQIATMRGDDAASEALLTELKGVAATNVAILEELRARPTIKIEQEPPPYSPERP